MTANKQPTDHPEINQALAMISEGRRRVMEWNAKQYGASDYRLQDAIAGTEQAIKGLTYFTNHEHYPTVLSAMRSDRPATETS